MSLHLMANMLKIYERLISFYCSVDCELKMAIKLEAEKAKDDSIKAADRTRKSNYFDYKF